MTIRQYIKGLKPTASGVAAICLCLFIIPVFADLFFLVFTSTKKAPVTMSSTLFFGYLYHVPYLLIYFALYFILLNLLFHLFKYKEY